MSDTESILAVLDDAASAGDFPILNHGYFYPADTRLSLFIGDDMWTLLLEVLVFDNHVYGHGAIRTHRYRYGTHVRGQGHLEPDLTVTADASSAPVFDPQNGQYVSQTPGNIRVRDRVFAVPADRGDYAADGISLADPDAVYGPELLRWLAQRARPLFFTQATELQEVVPSGARRVLSLLEWIHPDIMEGERPSDSETFRRCAEIAASGGRVPYAVRGEPNTHWSNWPTAGML